MNRPNRNGPNANSLFQGSDNFSLKAMFWNAGGLTNVKYTEIKDILYKEDIDLLGIVEAGASSENLQFYQVPGYQIYSLKRARQIASGIIVVAKASLLIKFHVSKEMTTCDKLEAVKIDVWKMNYHRQFHVCYNPPNNKPDLTWLEADWNNKSILYGDLNAHSSRWGYAQTDAIGRAIEDFIDSNPVQFIDNKERSPTFLSNAGHTSHPDIILSHPSLVNSIEHDLSGPPGGIGHAILKVIIKNNPAAKVHKEQRKTFWNTRKGKWTKFAELTDKLITEDLINGSTEKSCEAFSSKLLECALKAIPRGQVKKYSPFWNIHLEKLKNERDVARSNAVRTQLPSDQGLLKQKSALLKRAITVAKREACKSFLSKLDFRKDGARAHQYVSRLQRDSHRKNNPITFGNKELTCQKAIARSFCHFFAKNSNFSVNKGNGRMDISARHTCLNKLEQAWFEEPFQFEELNVALLATNKGKSPGPDGILPEFLVNCGEIARRTLLKLLNLVWATYYPSTWRKAEVVPILKSGKPASSPESYRQVSLTSAISKVYERMVLKRLTEYLDQMKLLAFNQAGFRSHRNTMEQVARFTQEVKEGFHRKQHTLAVFVDFKSAFDHVCRKRLLYKLRNLQIEGKLYKAIHSFLSQRYIRVKYDNHISPFKQTKQGLPQGSVLSPMLFNIMIDDLIQEVERNPGVQALLYADDLVVWATSSNVKALESCLNDTLVALKKWTEINEMVVNATKTEFQLFTLSTKPQRVVLQYDGSELPRTNEATYLGVKLDTKLNWGEHISSLVERGESRLRLLKRLSGIKWGASQDVLQTAYKCYVRPSMEYGAEVVATASETALGKLEKQQNKALRLITGGPCSTPITAMQLQADVEPLSVRRDVACLKLYERAMRTESEYWRAHVEPSQRLKSQVTFINKAKTLGEKLGLAGLPREGFPHTQPNVMKELPYKIQMTEEIKKEGTPDWKLKIIALETIANWYPPPNWFHVYTDGSAQGATKNAGAGVYSKEFQLSAPVGCLSSNFEGEIHAIVMALQAIKKGPWRQVVIFIDSKAAIMAVTSLKTTKTAVVAHCRAQLKELLDEGRVVVLQWIPSHCNVLGNEAADKLAKEGAAMDQPSPPVSMSTAKRIILANALQTLKDARDIEAHDRRWGTLIHASGRIPVELPRKVGVACFRLLTGHDYLQAHLHRIGLARDPACVLCNDGIMNGDHLDTCPALTDIRQQIINYDECRKKSALYWAARSLMADLPDARRS